MSSASDNKSAVDMIGITTYGRFLIKSFRRCEFLESIDFERNRTTSGGVTSVENISDDECHFKKKLERF